MAEAKRDGNYVPTLIAAAESDGATPVRVQVDPSNHGLAVDDNTTGSDHGGTQGVRDGNHIVVLMGVSSVDGVTPTAVYAEAATGKLLINSN